MNRLLAFGARFGLIFCSFAAFLGAAASAPRLAVGSFFFALIYEVRE